MNEPMTQEQLERLARMVTDNDPGRYLSQEERDQYEAAKQSVIDARRAAHRDSDRIIG